MTADPESSLQCAAHRVNALWKQEAAARIIDWDIVKLAGYAELMILSRGVLGKGSLMGKGLFGRAAGIMTVASGGVLFFGGAQGVTQLLELDRWARESGQRYFVGTLNWDRKYTSPMILMNRFRRRLTGFMPGSSPQGFATEVNQGLRP